MQRGSGEDEKFLTLSVSIPCVDTCLVVSGTGSGSSPSQGMLLLASLPGVGVWAGRRLGSPCGHVGPLGVPPPCTGLLVWTMSQAMHDGQSSWEYSSLGCMDKWGHWVGDMEGSVSLGCVFGWFGVVCVVYLGLMCLKCTNVRVWLLYLLGEQRAAPSWDVDFHSISEQWLHCFD